MVIGSFASYTKTKSVESAIWCLLTLDDDGVEQVLVTGICLRVTQVLVETRNGIEIPEQGQVQNCSFSFQATIKQNSMKNETNDRITNNNE